MNYRLILFDFDGTLLDSLNHAVVVYNRIAPKLGFRSITDVETARSMPTRKLLRALGIRFWSLHRLVRAYQEEVARDPQKMPFHNGISQLIEKLSQRQLQLGILSSNKEETIRRHLQEADLERHFAFVVGYPKLFGKAKAMKRILRQHSLQRNQLLYVGDEVRDIEAGHKAGIDTVAVCWGFHAEAMLVDAKPTVLAYMPDDVLNFINRDGE